MWPVPSNVRYATWKKKTPGALLLRKILRKFLAFDDAVGEHGFGSYFHGYEKRDLSVLEDRRRAMIRSGSMLKATTKRIADNIDASTPFLCRLGFIESLAALAALHSEGDGRECTYSSDFVVCLCAGSVGVALE